MSDDRYDIIVIGSGAGFADGRSPAPFETAGAPSSSSKIRSEAVLASAPE